MAPMSVMGVVITSSPGLRPRAAMAQCTAAEPEAHAIACLRPIRSANSRSSRITMVPRVELRVPLRIARDTSSISSAPRVLPLASASLGSAGAVCAAAAPAGSRRASVAARTAVAASACVHPAGRGVGPMSSTWAARTMAARSAPARAALPASRISGRPQPVPTTTVGTPSRCASSSAESSSVKSSAASRMPSIRAAKAESVASRARWRPTACAAASHMASNPSSWSTRSAPAPGALRIANCAASVRPVRCTARAGMPSRRRLSSCSREVAQSTSAAWSTRRADRSPSGPWRLTPASRRTTAMPSSAAARAAARHAEP